MGIIQILDSFSSGLSDSFNGIVSIDIDDRPFDSGSFGEVYRCHAINHQPLRIPQVAKIFFSSADPGYLTIIKLQKKIANLTIALRHEVNSLPGLQALPQASFKGLMEGRQVTGYISRYLDASRFLPFKMLFDPETRGLRKRYNAEVPISHKLCLGRQLAESAAFLREIGYIHADINAENIFIDTATPELAVIDFDSGSITDQDTSTKTTTWGKRDEWLAPEIADQVVRGSEVKVDLFTDSWSVAVGIYYFLFLQPPYCFLDQQSLKDLKLYFLACRWPSIPAQNICPNGAKLQLIIADELEKKHLQPLYERFKQTFNDGAIDGEKRTTYGQWKLALSKAEGLISHTAASPLIVPPSMPPVPSMLTQFSPVNAPRAAVTKQPTRANAVKHRPATMAPLQPTPPPAPLAPPPAAPGGSAPSFGYWFKRLVLGGFLLFALFICGGLIQMVVNGFRSISHSIEASRNQEAMRIAERKRLEQGFPGDWYCPGSKPLKILNITRNGGSFRAKYATKGGPLVLEGSILPDNRLQLTNLTWLNSFLSQYRGDFAYGAALSLSSDGQTLYAAINGSQNGKMLEMKRKKDKMPKTEDAPSYGFSSSSKGTKRENDGEMGTMPSSEQPSIHLNNPVNDRKVDAKPDNPSKPPEISMQLLKPFIGTWSDKGDFYLIQISPVPQGLLIRKCGVSAVAGTEFFGKYEGGKVTALGDPKDFYKAKLPELWVGANGELNYLSGVGLELLKKSTRPFPGVPFGPPANGE